MNDRSADVVPHDSMRYDYVLQAVDAVQGVKDRKVFERLKALFDPHSQPLPEVWTLTLPTPLHLHPYPPPSRSDSLVCPLVPGLQGSEGGLAGQVRP